MTDRALGRGLRITVHQGREAIRDRFLDHPPVPLRLSATPVSAAAAIAWQFQRLVGEADLLVVATDVTGMQIGVLAGVERRTGREPVVLLDSSIATDSVFGAALVRRMLAALLLRLAGVEDVPAALVARSHHAALSAGLRWFAKQHGDVTVYPQPESKVVPLRTAGMAVRIARTTRMSAAGGIMPSGADVAPVVLDLRGAEESSLIETARRLYRVRLPRRLVAVDPSSPDGQVQRGPDRTGTN
ncbi:MAG: hypothetical protein AB7O80_22800 [Acetobacteraceae bacterium]